MPSRDVPLIDEGAMLDDPMEDILEKIATGNPDDKITLTVGEMIDVLEVAMSLGADEGMMDMAASEAAMEGMGQPPMGPDMGMGMPPGGGGMPPGGGGMPPDMGGGGMPMGPGMF